MIGIYFELDHKILVAKIGDLYYDLEAFKIIDKPDRLINFRSYKPDIEYSKLITIPKTDKFTEYISLYTEEYEEKPKYIRVGDIDLFLKYYNYNEENEFLSIGGLIPSVILTKIGNLLLADYYYSTMKDAEIW